jgi:hypothetical protein
MINGAVGAVRVASAAVTRNQAIVASVEKYNNKDAMPRFYSLGAKGKRLFGVLLFALLAGGAYSILNITLVLVSAKLLGKLVERSSIRNIANNIEDEEDKAVLREAIQKGAVTGSSLPRVFINNDTMIGVLQENGYVDQEGKILPRFTGKRLDFSIDPVCTQEGESAVFWGLLKAQKKITLGARNPQKVLSRKLPSTTQIEPGAVFNAIVEAGYIDRDGIIQALPEKEEDFVLDLPLSESQRDGLLENLRKTQARAAKLQPVITKRLSKVGGVVV